MMSVSDDGTFLNCSSVRLSGYVWLKMKRYIAPYIDFLLVQHLKLRNHQEKLKDNSYQEISRWTKTLQTSLESHK